MRTNPCIDEVSGNIIEDISGSFRLFRTTTPDGNVHFNLELIDGQNRSLGFANPFGFRFPCMLGKQIYANFEFLNAIGNKE